MNELVVSSGNIIDEVRSGVISTSMKDQIESLLNYRSEQIKLINELYDIMTGEFKEKYMPVCEWFNGAKSFKERHGINSIIHFDYMDKEGAIRKLDAVLWQKSIALFRIDEFISPQEKNNYSKTFHYEHDVQPFTPEYVYPTLKDLYARRMEMFADHVCWIFEKLSRDHVTNRPEGFSKKMIFANNFETYLYNTYDKISDNPLKNLFYVVSLLTKNGNSILPDSYFYAVGSHAANNYGSYVDYLGGAIKLRRYKNGNCHVMIHDDIAMELNDILSIKYPKAIPSQFRTKTKKRNKVTPIVNTLPINVSTILYNANVENPYLSYKNMIRNSYNVDKKLLDEFENIWLIRVRTENDNNIKVIDEVMYSIGGVRYKLNNKSRYMKNGLYYSFDNIETKNDADDIKDLLHGIAATGVVPDDISHQFYPTKNIDVQNTVVDMLNYDGIGKVLEPSAGVGDLINCIDVDVDNVTCVEYSTLRSELLKLTYPDTINMDFIDYANRGTKFDFIVGNPPYNKNQWKTHSEACIELLNDNGTLVLVLPESARNHHFGPNLTVEYSKSFSNAFSNASISVVVVKITKNS